MVCKGSNEQQHSRQPEPYGTERLGDQKCVETKSLLGHLVGKVEERWIRDLGVSKRDPGSIYPNLRIKKRCASDSSAAFVISVLNRDFRSHVFSRRRIFIAMNFRRMR